MAITSVALTQEGTGLSGSGVSTVRRSYNAHYRVITDSPLTSPKDVELHFRTGRDSSGNPLPYYGRTWKWVAGGNDVEAICNKFEVNYQPGSSGIFKVEVGFEPQIEDTQSRQGEDGKRSDKPNEWIQTINRSYTQISVPVEKAIFEGFDPPNIANKFLEVGATHTPCNSAMVPYLPPIEELIDITVIRFGSYVADINDSDKWQGYINDQPFFIRKPFYRFAQDVPKWHGWLKHVGGSVEFINNEIWWKRDVELWINPRGWVDEYLDKGDMVRVAPGDQKQGAAKGERWSLTELNTIIPRSEKMVGKNGVPVKAPCMLDGNGGPLQDLKKPVWLKWRTKKQKNLQLFPW